MRRGAALLVAASAAAGCAVVTGSTDGYHPLVVDAGCGDDRCAAGCTSAADCADGGEVCCLVTIASVAMTTACMRGPCVASIPVQLCKSSNECFDGGVCTKQSCPGTLVPIQVCGTLPNCTVMP
jgi:hypothetical protein